MVLKVSSPAANSSTPTEQKEPDMVLELSSYRRCNLGGVLYEKGVPYRFTRAQAEDLLGMEDEITLLPIWRVWRAERKAMVVPREIGPTDMRHQDLSVLDLKPAREAAKEEIGGDDAELNRIFAEADRSTDGAVNV